MKKEEYARLFSLEKSYWWHTGLHELTEFYLKRNKSTAGWKILDAGCGTGGLMVREKKYGEVYGIDFCEEAVSFCKQRGLENIQLGDLNTWIPPTHAYDVVTCMDVLYHSQIKSDGDVLQKFYVTLKPGGMLILNLPAFDCLKRGHDEVVETARRYRKPEAVQKLKAAGFSVVHASYRLPVLFVYLLARKVLNLFGRANTDSNLKPLPPVLNSFLLRLHRVENSWIEAGQWMPFGSSVFIVAKKPL